MHQRLMAYQWDGGHAIPIANVAGCVIQSDLYGVRLDDYDQDGLLEILAAPDGVLNNRAYKWNGAQFVFWSDIPNEPITTNPTLPTHSMLPALRCRPCIPRNSLRG